MFLIGAHLSTANGLLAMAQDALTIDATTFQFFSRNPRGTGAKVRTEREIAGFSSLVESSGSSGIVAHAPYTLNPCSANPQIRTLAVQIMKEDLAMLAGLPVPFYNIHPGSHGGQGTETGIMLTADALNQVLSGTDDMTVLLETMAGKGSEIGSSLEQLREIINRLEMPEQTGVCIDLCHLWDAGYDIKDGLNGFLEHFDAVIGIDRLRAVHLNDSLNERGSHKDRHALLGEGYIGMDACVRIINHPALKHLPFVLETPTGLEGHAREITELRSRHLG